MRTKRALSDFVGPSDWRVRPTCSVRRRSTFRAIDGALSTINAAFPTIDRARSTIHAAFLKSLSRGAQEQRARSAQTPQDQHRVCLDYYLFTRVHRGVVVQTGVDRNLPLLAPSVGWQLERHCFVVSVEEEVETVVDDL